MDDIVWPPRKSVKPKGVVSKRTEPAMHQFHLTPTPSVKESLPPGAEAELPSEEPAPEPDPTPQTEPQPEAPEPEISPVIIPDTMPKRPKKKFNWRISFRHIHLSKKQWALFIAVILILVGGGAVGANALYHHFRQPPPQPTEVVKKAKKVAVVKKPVTEASRLTGSQIAPADNLRPVTGIMIENSPDARPQAGLNEAGVVYEAIAEGGITRFLALYHEARPMYIGPVRSVRPYYLDFLMPFDGSIAHVGGAPQALSDIKSFGVKDLDQFANGNSYNRITTRYAPHNVYTNFDLLDNLNRSKGFTSSTFNGFVRKAPAPLKTPITTSVDLAISGPIYDVHYDYDAKTNTYKRSEGGKPHVDDRSGTQLAPSVVIALVVGRGIDSDGQHTAYTTTGSGALFVFQDGQVVGGTWSKASRRDQFMFTDSTGATLKLNPGQTWISLVDAATDVNYK